MSRLAKQEKNTRKKKKKGGGECACLYVRTKLSYSWGSKSIPLRFLRLRLLRVPPSIVPDSFAIVAPPPIPQTNPHTRYTLLQQKVFQTLTLIPELLLLPPTEIRFAPPLIVVSTPILSNTTAGSREADPCLLLGTSTCQRLLIHHDAKYQRTLLLLRLETIPLVC
jgi:hypothetical protein